MTSGRRASSSEAPWIMGISSSHNGGVCLLHGAELVVAVQEERLLRQKRAENPVAYDSLAIEYCLRRGGITAADLHTVVVCTTPPAHTIHEDVTLNRALQPARHGIETLFISHHLAHAAGAYAQSGFEECAVLVVDGYGSKYDELADWEQRGVLPGQLEDCIGPSRGEPREIISIYAADERGFTCAAKHISAASLMPKSGMPYYWSLGTMYEAVGLLLFGSRLDGPGKVMGLAPYGTPTIPADEFLHWRGDRFDFLPGVSDRYPDARRWPQCEHEYQDLAASVQRAMECGLLSVVAQAHRLTGRRHLAYAGGVALNCVANERLLHESPFDRIFIPPAAEDSGTAVGAAYYGLWHATRTLPQQRLRRDETGISYSCSDVGAAIDAMPGLRCVPADNATQRTAELLASGAIVGWFQDGAELGPRALGQRSILCDPRGPDAKAVLNARVKFREAFRPFAPIVLKEHVAEWFAVDGSRAEACESPFMLRVVPFRAEQAALVPAVVHVDGTGRLQTVAAEDSPRLYDLVSKFYGLTGVPIVLNTSFNIAGEPIVETPADALWCFLYTGMDYCVLGDRIVAKQEGFESVLQFRYELTADSISEDRPVGPAGNGARPATSSDAAPFLFSAHADRLMDLELSEVRQQHLLVRIMSRKPWGRVVHFADRAFVPLLDAIDGGKSGGQIAAELAAAHGWSTQKVTSMLAALVRASLVRPIA